MEEIVRKIPKGGEVGDFYVLVSKWQGDDLSLSVIDNDIAWTGKLDSSRLNYLCNALHTTKENFIADLKRALSEDENNFTCLVAEENFIVKKIDIKTKIKVKFCEIQLQKIPSIPTYLNIVSGLLDQEKSNRNKISKLIEEVQFLKTEREEFKLKLEHYANTKASLETILYSKFCTILNAKKEKITYLESVESKNSVNENGMHLSEEHFEQNTETRKRTCQDYPIPKRMCTANANLEESRGVGNCATSLDTNVAISNQTENHFDSDTDVDTDDENLVQSTACHLKTVSSCVDNVEKISESILPKRETSSHILPKRVAASSSISHILPKREASRSIENAEKRKQELSPCQSKYQEEFNSQSLLDEY